MVGKRKQRDDFKNHSGETFKSLTAIKRIVREVNGCKKTYYLCRCACGYEAKYRSDSLFLRQHDWCEKCKPSSKIKVKCSYCGVDIIRWKHESVKTHFFCDRECKGKWSLVHLTGENSIAYKGGKIKDICKHCGKVVWRWPKDIDSQYCSRLCYWGYMRTQHGNTPPEWGPRTDQQKIRSGAQYNKWRSNVFHRDAFTCQCCGSPSVNLQAHHIKPFGSIYEEEDSILYDVDNGLTFCKPCHQRYHKRYGKKEGSPSDIREYISSLWGL